MRIAVSGFREDLGKHLIAAAYGFGTTSLRPRRMRTRTSTSRPSCEGPKTDQAHEMRGNTGGTLRGRWYFAGEAPNPLDFVLPWPNTARNWAPILTAGARCAIPQP